MVCAPFPRLVRLASLAMLDVFSGRAGLRPPAALAAGGTTLPRPGFEADGCRDRVVACATPDARSLMARLNCLPSPAAP